MTSSTAEFQPSAATLIQTSSTTAAQHHGNETQGALGMSHAVEEWLATVKTRRESARLPEHGQEPVSRPSTPYHHNESDDSSPQSPASSQSTRNDPEFDNNDTTLCSLTTAHSSDSVSRLPIQELRNIEYSLHKAQVDCCRPDVEPAALPCLQTSPVFSSKQSNQPQLRRKYPRCAIDNEDSDNLVWITSCLQCSIKGVECNKATPCCSTCQRSDAGSCLAQFVPCGDSWSTPILLRLSTDDEQTVNDKIARYKALLATFRERLDRRNWAVPICGEKCLTRMIRTPTGYIIKKNRTPQHPGRGFGPERLARVSLSDKAVEDELRARSAQL